MAILKFFRGAENLYSSITHKDGIYFCTDSGKIIIDGKQYGGVDRKDVSEIKINPENRYQLQVTYSDGKVSNIELPHTYSSAINDKTLTVPTTVGGIVKGTKLSEIEGKTTDAILDDLLFPTVDPTFIAPTASISLKGYSSVVEAGVAGPDLVNNFTTGYNAGSITLNGVKQNDRGGALDLAKSFIYVDGSESNRATPSKIKLGNTTFHYKASYGAGPQPKNNKGSNFSTPLSAGSVVSSAVTVNGTYPWYATTLDGTLKKQALIRWNNNAGTMDTPEFTVVAHNGTTVKQSFKVPRRATQLQMFNTVSGKWETISGFPAAGGWTESNKEEAVNGTMVNYYTYVYSGEARAAAKLKVKF